MPMASGGGRWVQALASKREWRHLDYGITKNFNSSDERFQYQFKYQGGKKTSTEAVTSNTDSFIVGCGFGPDDPVKVSYDVKHD
ncbi:MAG: hypothetical protein DQL93_0100 (endogenous virus) [Lactobacillus phage ViSo-2018b]|nr:MAG: hypothetical protein DQL93_0100 [Lactobacillus phage ViSo-2018b]